MEIIAETERLILRKFLISDADEFYSLNSDLEVLKFTGDVPFSSIKEAELFLNNYSDYKINGFGRWAVILKETNKFLGWCGLKLNEENIVDLGFRFFRNEWGKGFATESSIASLNYGFTNLNINEIFGRTSIENIASKRVLEKIGMKFIKMGKFSGISNAVYYSIKRKEFFN